MVLHRLAADEQAAGNLARGVAVGDELEDLLLAWSEGRCLTGRGGSRGDLRVRGELGEDRAGELGRERLTGRGRDRGRHHFLHRAVLGEERRCAGAQCLFTERVFVVHREHDDRQIRVGGVQTAGCFDATEHRHRHVHDHELGPQLVDELHGFGTVAGFAEHDEPGVFHGSTQRLAQQLVIVGDQDCGHFGTSSETDTRVPSPGLLSTTRCAPRASARSRIPMSP